MTSKTAVRRIEELDWGMKIRTLGYPQAESNLDGKTDAIAVIHGRDLPEVRTPIVLLPDDFLCKSLISLQKVHHEVLNE